MVLDDVAHCAGLVVITGALAYTFLLSDGDEDRFNQGAIPDRLEEGVGKAKRKDVLNRVLGQVVIDSEDLLFLEGLGNLRVQLMRGCQVVTERLLENDPSGAVAFRSQAGQ